MAYYASGLYDTEQQALEASVYDFVTAGGQNSLRQALQYATKTREESIEEARDFDWAWHHSDGERSVARIESWGVCEGSRTSDAVEFNSEQINAAFDAVADRLRKEIEDGLDDEP